MVVLFLITFKCFIRFFHFATLSVYFLKVRCLSLKETNNESNRGKKQGNESEKKGSKGIKKDGGESRAKSKQEVGVAKLEKEERKREITLLY